MIRVTVSSRTIFLFFKGTSLFPKEMLKIFGKLKLINNKVRQIGAASLELCYVACGRVDSFFMIGVNSWDVAAGVLIVKEARK